MLWLRAISGVCRMHGSSCRPPTDRRLSQVGAVLPLPISFMLTACGLPLRSQALHTAVAVINMLELMPPLARFAESDGVCALSTRSTREAPLPVREWSSDALGPT